MNFSRALLAPALGIAFFTILPYYAYPVAVEGSWGDPAFEAEVQRIYWLGFGGSAVVGVILVFLAGRGWGLLLAVACPFVGGLLFVTLASISSAATWDPIAVIVTGTQYVLTSGTGAVLAALARASLARLGFWRRTD
ncbi:hypothetical protein Rxycam_02110 [Rubrobacter xylanophilus DSM 9941]|uniref:hypothetical protein n=1 Tax=Rubrobacter xylanophilus TaxID=49319 RepID=UPI001C6439D6|nr:hypothetical protein [Rubrobacter xylanophilus]QYJ16277.1 hypothetical protein Rxycam_02110 [Rubrobacter xylanophilus DSM 9941]